MAATRIAVIGCGFYAQNHLASWRDLAGAGAALVGVCDTDPAKAEAAAATFGARPYTDPEAMLAETGPDLVEIVTRVDSHRALAELAFGHVRGVIVQKPFAPTLEDAKAVVAGASRAGVWLAVHENFRFQPPMRRVIDLIDADTIGPPSWARLQFRTGWDVYATQPYFLTETRLCMADVGVHVLDCARRILGEVTQVTAETQQRNPQLRGEDTATILLRHASGAVSVVDCTYEARCLPDPFPETLVRVEGPKGCVILKAGGGIALTVDGSRRDLAVDYPSPPWTEPRWAVSQTGCLEACRHFLERFRAGRPAETAGEDNLRTVALVEASYASASQGIRVTPPQFREG
jgi:predicted dehydrogenase